jgi:hypothetical protein
MGPNYPKEGVRLNKQRHNGELRVQLRVSLKDVSDAELCSATMCCQSTGPTEGLMSHRGNTVRQV